MKSIAGELSYKTSRSSGAGGQNVNKVETSVTVLWDVDGSLLFDEDEKRWIKERLKNRINAQGVLQVSVSESRFQLQNKKKAVEKIDGLVRMALVRPKARLKTKPTKAQKERRIQDKKQHAERKERRRFRF
ncbi:alternative ribosome rescue aminoacyl-tRNA hydrolase ArfB [Bergeyella sp. RCAD1439]|uniref:alternative ribosome rescue aminoacyl-tRNA hydrolase ArfB n=1 Tax=Bergeyella anatis TaxID=3113737 RepID=UPI002E182F39|nr:alternative ribosome rescue aminoacyl-tRNA hydrolase ArfB [Bergeyella sp. RCAD1439]